MYVYILIKGFLVWKSVILLSLSQINHSSPLRIKGMEMMVGDLKIFIKIRIVDTDIHEVKDLIECHPSKLRLLIACECNL